jgi:hypothetical protein
MQKVCKPVTTIFRTWVFAGYTLGLASPRSLNLKRDIATTQYRHPSAPLLGHTHGINRQSHRLKKEKVFVVQSRKMMDSKIGSLKNSTPQGLGTSHHGHFLAPQHLDLSRCQICSQRIVKVIRMKENILSTGTFASHLLHHSPLKYRSEFDIFIRPLVHLRFGNQSTVSS